MITAIDTNILLNLLIPEAPHAASSEAVLDGAYHQGALIISETVYAELAARFPSPEELNRFLQTTGIRLERSQPEALHAASEAWLMYSSRRGQGLHWSKCGQVQEVNCDSCGVSIRSQQHILADFLIGGHALNQGDQLLTRDRGYFQIYFPGLHVQEHF